MSDTVVNEGSPHKYFHIIPNIADDELDPYEYRLYGHYIRVCGNSDKPCKQSVRTIAKITQMGVNKVQQARAGLAEKGYIRNTLPTPDQARKRETVHTVLLDRWGDNVARYSVSNSIQSDTPTVSDSIQSPPLTVSDSIHKKNKDKEQKEKDSAPKNGAGVLSKSKPAKKGKTDRSAVSLSYYDTWQGEIDQLRRADGLDTRYIHWNEMSIIEQERYISVHKALNAAHVSPAEYPDLVKYCRDKEHWRTDWKITYVLEHITAWRAKHKPAPRPAPVAYVPESGLTDEQLAAERNRILQEYLK